MVNSNCRPRGEGKTGHQDRDGQVNEAGQTAGLLGFKFATQAAERVCLVEITGFAPAHGAANRAAEVMVLPVLVLSLRSPWLAAWKWKPVLPASLFAGPRGHLNPTFDTGKVF